MSTDEINGNNHTANTEEGAGSSQFVETPGANNRGTQRITIPDDNGVRITNDETSILSIIRQQNKQKCVYDKARCNAPTYMPGDYVMIKRVTMPGAGESAKLLPHYKGPYVITEVLPNDRYRVSDIPGLQRTQKFYDGVVAVDQIKRVLEPDGDVDGSHDDSFQSDDDSTCFPRRSKRLVGKSKT